MGRTCGRVSWKGLVEGERGGSDIIFSQLKHILKYNSCFDSKNNYTNRVRDKYKL